MIKWIFSSKIKFFDKYISNLELLRLNKERLKDRDLEDIPIEIIEAWNYVSVNFDDFNDLLLSVDFDKFPYRAGTLLGGYDSYQGGYLDNSDYQMLLNESTVLKTRINRKFKKNFNPIYLIKKITNIILKLPYNLISTMGFDPEELIKTPIGLIFAIIILVLFFGVIGFSVDQIVEIFKHIPF